MLNIAKYLNKIIVGTPSPLLRGGGGGVGPSKNWVTAGGEGGNFLLERGDKPEKGVWCRNGGLPLFYYFTVQSHLLCVREK